MNKQEQVIKTFREVFDKMAWLNRQRMEECLKPYKPSEIHCIEYIGCHDDPNVTRLAEAFYQTRGAISKMTKKLIQKGVIESYQKAENKKEIYFCLTPQGEAVYEIHEKLHQEFRERDQVVFKQIGKKELNRMLHFLEAYGRHLEGEINKLGVMEKVE
ncbi:MarR family transcriptional regulator [Clostridia bacterium]|nr:MarR family transcriptional regulator [Clostridia bacterium]